MPSPKPPYHRVNLEAALLEAAATLLATGGFEALSLRELGRAAGVSRSAAYHYFPDKAALLDRLGEIGFARLSARIADAVAEHDTWTAQLHAGFRAYVQFALDEPARFRLMFANVLSRDVVQPAGADAPALRFSSSAARAAFGDVVDRLREAQHRGLLGPTSPLVMMQCFWAVAHGVAELTLGDNLKPADQRDVVLRTGLDALLRLFAPPAPTE